MLVPQSQSHYCLMLSIKRKSLHDHPRYPCKDPCMKFLHTELTVNISSTCLSLPCFSQPSPGAARHCPGCRSRPCAAVLGAAYLVMTAARGAARGTNAILVTECSNTEDDAILHCQVMHVYRVRLQAHTSRDASRCSR